MKSKIFMSEIIKNKARKFGESPEYIPVLFVRNDGSEAPGLLTSGDIQKAVDRAAKNSEDVEEKTIWELLFGKGGS